MGSKHGSCITKWCPVANSSYCKENWILPLFPQILSVSQLNLNNFKHPRHARKYCWRQAAGGQGEGTELRKSVPLTMKQILCRQYILDHKRVSLVHNLSETIFYLKSSAAAWGRDSRALSESSILSKRIPRWEISCIWKENKTHSLCWYQRGIRHHLREISMRSSENPDVMLICH